DYVSEQLMNPDFRAAYEDASSRSRLLVDLVARRRHLGLSQRDVAQRMATTQSAVSELEAGATDPRLSTLQRYSRALACRLVTYVHAYDVRPAQWRIHHSAPRIVAESTRSEDRRFAMAARR